MKASPVTGGEIPDDSARVPVERYVNARRATWPQADFVVGNPPFIGNKRMRTALGDGYVEALRGAWHDVPDSADFVMYWWHQAAEKARLGELKRFGLITTNSIRQAFNRKVVEQHLSDTRLPLSLVYAVPDHPWVDTSDGAGVRISMSVGTTGEAQGLSLTLVSEHELDDGEIECAFSAAYGRVHSDLSAGAALVDARGLRANQGLAFTGMYPLGQGFVVLPEEVRAAVGNDGNVGAVLKPFATAKDLTQRGRGARIVDFYPRTMLEARDAYPGLFQWVLDRVKPERDQNPVEERRRNWWLFTRPVAPLREALRDLSAYIVVPRTAKWFTFQLVSTEVVPDSSVVAIGLEDCRDLGVLSSAVHLAWARALGGTLEDRPRYQHQRTFNPFPFPDWHGVDKFGSDIVSPGAEYPSDRVRRLGALLDSHRKRQQAAHPDLTLTAMYNVLEKLRNAESLNSKERVVHESGLVSVLKQIHDELDEAVLLAYGWSDLQALLRIANGLDRGQDGQSRHDAKRSFEAAVLERLLALNLERAAAEARGDVLWLRPEFQNPSADSRPEQIEIDATDGGNDSESEDEGGFSAKVVKPTAWPKEPVAQVRAVAEVLADSRVPMTLDDIAARFTARGPWKKRLPQLLAMVSALGRVEAMEDGRWRGKP